MSQRFTVISPVNPEISGLVWALAQINPNFLLVMDEETGRSEVYDEDDTTLLLTIDPAAYIQVPGEIERIFGSNVGYRPQEGAKDAPAYWLDINASHESSKGPELAAYLAKIAADFTDGTAVEHGRLFRHLGEESSMLREEWRP